MIHGRVAPGFDEVQAEFLRNFTDRNELGAACAVYYRGEKVVDLWGGYRDERTCTPWEEDTLVCVYSSTKGMAAAALAVAHARGLFDLDRPVADYWPEFAQNGKQNVTVRQLLSHQAGLSVIDTRLTPALLSDPDALAAALARQKPAWKPGTRYGYHALSLGWYESELIRRVDPQHRTIGVFLRDEVAAPLGEELYIGLPRDLPDNRLATIDPIGPLGALMHLHIMPPRMVLPMLWPWSLAGRTVRNPRMRGPADIAGRRFRHVEMPSGNGFTTARGLAHLYGAMAMGGAELGLTEQTMQELTAPARPPSGGTNDLFLKLPMAYSCGFMKPCPGIPFSPSSRAFGSPGAGGSLGFADPNAKLGYAYVTNRMGYYVANDPRERALREAAYRCISRLEHGE